MFAVKNNHAVKWPTPNNWLHLVLRPIDNVELLAAIKAGGSISTDQTLKIDITPGVTNAARTVVIDKPKVTASESSSFDSNHFVTMCAADFTANSNTMNVVDFTSAAEQGLAYYDYYYYKDPGQGGFPRFHMYGGMKFFWNRSGCD